MRLLVTGDLHYALRQLDWVLAQAPDHDAVVLTGDLLDLASAVPLDAQVRVVLGYLERLAGRVTTVVASGNHDLTNRDDAGEKAAAWLARASDVGVTTDLDSVRLGDIHLSVCPFWDGPVGRAEVDRFLAAEAERSAAAGSRWWWAYHWPPPDLPVSWIGTTSYGDADLAGWIDSWDPAVVLTGHVHQAPFADGGSWISPTAGGTWVVNAGRQIGPVPSHIVIDTDTEAATWSSIDEREERSIATPAAR